MDNKVAFTGWNTGCMGLCSIQRRADHITYFYTSVTFNPMEVAQNMKANGGFIPGIRPGRATVEYLNRVMTRITFVGAVFLAAVAILPTIVSQLGGLNFHFGGTSLLIAVGVALDTMKQLENQMVMRNYQGFLK